MDVVCPNLIRGEAASFRKSPHLAPPHKAR